MLSRVNKESFASFEQALLLSLLGFVVCCQGPPVECGIKMMKMGVWDFS